MQFGVCAGPEDASWIAATGADFIEAHVQNFLKPDEDMWQPPVSPADLAVPVAGYNCFFPGNLKITGPHADLARIAAYARRTVERAAAMGSDFIVFGSGGARSTPEGWPPRKAKDQLVATMKAIGPIAAAAGLTIVVEPLNCRECNILNDLPEALSLVRRAGTPGLAVLSDFYHFSVDRQPLGHLDECTRLLAHVHIAEPTTRGLPGPGMTDYRPFLRRLKAIGYNRRMSIECAWTDMRAELGPCLEFLRQEWDAA